MKKPKLKWEKSGRSYVAHAGRLRLIVRRNPITVARPFDPGWRVREVFGNHFPVTEDFAYFDAAAVAAETAARTMLKAAAKALGRRR